MARSINYRIRIRTYDPKTKCLETFESIYSFLKIYKYNKMSSTILKGIRDGKIVKYENHYVCKKSVNGLGKKVRKLHSHEVKKMVFQSLRNIKQDNEKIFDSAVFILDKNFKIKSVFIGKLIDLAEKKNLDYEALKSRVHRFKITRDNFYNGKIKNMKSMCNEHYCYVKDYIKK